MSSKESHKVNHSKSKSESNKSSEMILPPKVVRKFVIFSMIA